MPALLTVLTEDDLAAYARGTLDGETAGLVEQAAASDERVRRVLSTLATLERTLRRPRRTASPD